MADTQELQTQLADALTRIQHLEEAVNGGQKVPRWQYLVDRPHRWRRQLCIKGRNMTVGQLVSTVHANQYTPEQAAEQMELPLECIREALAYYAQNRGLIEMEAAEERRRLAQRGYALESKDLPR